MLVKAAPTHFSNSVRVHLMVCHKVFENILFNISTLNAVRDSRRVTIFRHSYTNPCHVRGGIGKPVQRGAIRFGSPFRFIRKSICFLRSPVLSLDSVLVLSAVLQMPTGRHVSCHLKNAVGYAEFSDPGFDDNFRK